MKTILISISLIAVLVSCNRGLPSEKIKVIDSLANKVDSTLEQYATIDSSKAIDYATTYQENLKYVKTELKDTVDKEIGSLIGKYYRLHKSMAFIKGEYNPIKEELKASQQQLKDLKYDAENGLVDETQFKRYINLEKENATKAIKASERILKMYRVSMKNYDKMNPTIDSLINANQKKVKNV